MKDSFKLNIGKPCAEEFNHFAPSKAGGFCRSCQKEVVDFTMMSDKEIARYFKKQTQNTCGRFYPSQLKTYASTAPSARKPQARQVGAGISFSILSLLTAGSSQAQHQAPLATIIDVAPDSEVEVNEANYKKHFIEGVVTSQDDPIPGVNVVLQGSDTGTVTDFDGKFVFPEAVEPGSVLIFSFIGYINQEVTVAEDTSETIRVNVVFEEEHYDLMGEVSVHQVYASEPTFWQKLSNWFR